VGWFVRFVSVSLPVRRCASLTHSLLVIFFAALVTLVASEHSESSESSESESAEELQPICSLGCVRYVKGFDVTGITNTLVVPANNVCECINTCVRMSGTCAAFVWKFTSASNIRTCVLYSNFNLPPDSTAVFDLASTDSNLGTVVGAGPNGNIQFGGQVPSCTIDGQPTSSKDPNCVSGAIWLLDNNNIIC